MIGFSRLPFNLAGRVYRSVMPYGSYDPHEKVYAAYLSAQISAVVVLAEAEEMVRSAGRNLIPLYQRQGWHVLHLPVKDFHVPERESLRQVVSSALQAARDGEHLVIHCSAGVGRTGMFAACMAKQSFAIPGEQAISWVRRYIPGAVETEAQRRLVLDF